MKRIASLLLILFLAVSAQTFAQYPPFTKWYQNPLGFEPVNLHTANGIIIPAVAATAILLLTKNDKAPANRFSYVDHMGVSYGYYASKTTVYQNNLGLLYHARNFMALGAEFSTVRLADDINNTWGAGLRPFVRFIPCTRTILNYFFKVVLD